jgi:hypothetical protein
VEPGTPGNTTVPGVPWPDVLWPDVLWPVGCVVDGMVSTVGAGLGTATGVPCNRADTSVTPGASGGGTVGSPGPGAVDSPITGPITPG